MTKQQINFALATYLGYKYVSMSHFNDQVFVSNKKHHAYDFDPCSNWNTASLILRKLRLQLNYDGDPLVNAMKDALTMIEVPSVPNHPSIKMFRGKYVPNHTNARTADTSNGINS